MTYDNNSSLLGQEQQNIFQEIFFYGFLLAFYFLLAV